MSLHGMRGRLRRLEQRAFPFAVLAMAIQRRMSGGDLPKSKRLADRVERFCSSANEAIEAEESAALHALERSAHEG